MCVNYLFFCCVGVFKFRSVFTSSLSGLVNVNVNVYVTLCVGLAEYWIKDFINLLLRL